MAGTALAGAGSICCCDVPTLTWATAKHGQTTSAILVVTASRVIVSAFCTYKSRRRWLASLLSMARQGGCGVAQHNSTTAAGSWPCRRTIQNRGSGRSGDMSPPVVSRCFRVASRQPSSCGFQAGVCGDECCHARGPWVDWALVAACWLLPEEQPSRWSGGVRRAPSQRNADGLHWHRVLRQLLLARCVHAALSQGSSPFRPPPSVE